ncbi:MAG: response regulator [Bacteroidetes bacterium]|nr:response regulator [Bacteroidota bacterium]
MPELGGWDPIMRMSVVLPSYERSRELNRTLAGEGWRVGEAENGLEALTQIRERHPDVVLHDITMPEVDGFGVLEAIGVDRMPVTIFVTAYQQYALQAFDAHAISPNRCDRHGYSSLLPLSSGDRLADDRLRRVGARARRLRALQHRAVGFRSE